ncbi:MAG: membrane protein of unknown function [Promethearchaeota archaeon]|nr:MAG: membrane protein of unknown function [Candidatus Lokiarchaeota archaeon]
MELSEKIKKFWNEFKEKWLWVNIGAYMMLMLVLWIGFFLDASPIISSSPIIQLEVTIIISFSFPLVIAAIYYLKKPSATKSTKNIILIVSGCISLGFPIWLIFLFFFFGAPWAPLQDLQNPMRSIIQISSMIPTYGLAAYLMYKIVEKRTIFTVESKITSK